MYHGVGLELRVSLLHNQPFSPYWALFLPYVTILEFIIVADFTTITLLRKYLNT